MGRQSRQCVRSSQAWDLIENDATEAQVVDALTDVVAEAVPRALAAANEERAPAPRVVLIERVTQFVGLVGQSWTAAGRLEFIGLAERELAKLPGDITLAALDDARREVNDGRHLVNWIYKTVEKRTSRLDAEIKRLEILASLLPNEG